MLPELSVVNKSGTAVGVLHTVEPLVVASVWLLPVLKRIEY